MRSKQSKLTIKEVILFGLFGALMYATKVVMAALPNIHLVAMFIVSLTVVFRKKALFPIYVYVFLEGLFGGFTLWWLPYLYIWTILWGIVMLLPKNIPTKWQPVVYMSVAACHGITYGLLWAPAQAALTNVDIMAWWISGIPFDITHAIGNLLSGLLIVPMIKIFQKCVRGE